MKKIIVCILFVTLSMFLFSQQFTYSKVVEINNCNRIEIQKIEDYLRIAKNNSIHEILINENYFFYQLDAFLYSMKNNGYNTIDDYISGSKTKYLSGKYFYLAKRNQLKNQEEAQYFESEYFYSGDDYRKAQKIGFIGKGINEKRKSFYGLLRKKDIVDNLQIASWLVFCINNDISQKQEKIYDQSVNIDNIDGWSNNLITNLGNDIYLLSITIDDNRRNINEKNGEGNKKSIIMSDAICYYLAKLARYENYEQYSARTNDNKNMVIGSDQIVENINMKNIKEVQAAFSAGFTTGEEYYIAQFYSIQTKKEYDVLKAFLNKCEEFRNKFKLENLSQIGLIYKIANLPSGTMISIEKFVEKTNLEIANDSQLKAIHFNNINVQSVESIFNQNKDLNVIANYSADTRVIIRK